MKALSVVIITYNEARNIGRCIHSVKSIADEVVVLDSYSSDDTVAVATALGAVVEQHTFYGYTTQKNRAIQLASHNFILSLDADEALSPELSAAIAKAKTDPEGYAYRMNRCNWYMGRFIRHGLWYPDRKIRLFDRRDGYCGGLNPHDRIELRDSVPVRHLPGDLLHYTYHTPEEYIERNEEVSRTAAQSLFDNGIKRSKFKIILSPLWAFVNGYLLRLGFLDGRRGWTIALHCARQCYMKYRWLYMLQKQAEGQAVGPGTKTMVQTNS